jgi:outer membrane protein assembly factor BamE (lipoprotein component of BamABCDE complex)
MLRSIASPVLFIILMAFLPLAGCDRSGAPVAELHATKMTRANYDQVHDKASKEEVRAILGAPTSEKTEDKIIYHRTTWRYVEGDKYINITFKNDELDSKDTNLGT